MVGIDKHKNIFYFYGSDNQLENNITKAFVNILDPDNLKENVKEKNSPFIKKFFEKILKRMGKDIKLRDLKKIELQKSYEDSIPDVVFTFENAIIGVESKYKDNISSKQLETHWKNLQAEETEIKKSFLIVLAPEFIIKEYRKNNSTQQKWYICSWEEVYNFFEEAKDDFLTKQFLQYMGLMHMTERFTAADFDMLIEVNKIENETPDEILKGKFDDFIKVFIERINKNISEILKPSKKKTDENLWITITKCDKTNEAPNEFHLTSHLTQEGIDLMFTTQDRVFPQKLAALLGTEKIDSPSFWENKPVSDFWTKIEKMADIAAQDKSCEFRIKFLGRRQFGLQKSGHEEHLFDFEMKLENDKEHKLFETRHLATIDARKKYLGNILKELYQIKKGTGQPYYYFRISCLVKRKGIEDKKTIDEQIDYFIEETKPIIEMYKFFQELLNKE